jgi:peptidyl-dipeptidase Dcp
MDIQSSNPLLETWSGAFGIPPFERIKPEHFRPAFDRAMAEHESEIEAIAGRADEPSFDNTSGAL